MSEGLLAVFTGNGKGKTTAALGLTFRAIGHGKKVCFIQFIKGKWQTGESILASSFPQNLDFHVMGKGFTWNSENLENDRQAAMEAWDLAVRTIRENRYDLIVLDELTYLVHYNMLPEDELIEVLTSKPKGMHLVVTGRYASERLQQVADLVTEMKNIRHPYSAGIKAQKGFDF